MSEQEQNRRLESPSARDLIARHSLLQPDEEARTAQGPDLPVQADAAERRRAERHPCDLQPFWLEWGSGPNESAEARVHNISATGLCLNTPCRVRPGSVLVIKLLSEAHGLSRPLLVRVIHSTVQENGRWLSGGAFVRRLSDQELEAILRASRSE